MASSFDAFGPALRFFRKRARLTQDGLGRAVGYSREQITHLESGRRVPDVTSVAALFAPELGLAEQEAAQLIGLATRARNEPAPTRVTHTRTVTVDEVVTTDSDVEPADTSSQAEQHRQAAQWAEMAEGDLLKAAREYAAAGDLKEAVDALTDQGTMLAGQGRAEEAAQVIDAILAALDRRAGRRAGYRDLVCRLLTTRGDALLNTSRAAEAESDYQQAITLATGAAHANLTYRLCACLAQRGKAADAVAMARAALAELPAHLMLIRAQVRVVEAGALMNLTRFDEAVDSARAADDAAAALSIATPLAAANIRARANSLLGAVHAMRQSFDSAVSHWRLTIDTARVAGMRALEYRTQGNIASASFERGDIAASESACGLAIDGLRAIDDQSGLSRLLHLRTLIAYVRDEMPAAISYAEEAIAVKTALGDIGSLALSRAQHGKLLMIVGRRDDARGVLDVAMREASDAGNQRVQGFAQCALSELDIADGYTAAAAERCRALLSTPIALEDAKFRADVGRVLALAHAADGDLQPARAVDLSGAGGGVEITLELRLLEALLARIASLDALTADAVASGYALHARRARQLARALAGGDDRAAVLALVL